MSAIVQKILVVGGNGLVGSAVCKAALARGTGVASISKQFYDKDFVGLLKSITGTSPVERHVI
ncbi:uncharacterized protein EDB91DRAFT_1247190 [Suillus paluster]|uniref:uncharacterized protein n=1 Tax=Suillus paluster TaxID=48578 RepID=UPI001B886E79|nr:uncharacterized protein EDB91DRAFT_1247190 [Suillus paluster]KAG1743704.1 hypothetical protein EDB91DRAFT_1247190 [Suillus paluster]